MVADGLLNPDSVPAGFISATLPMDEFCISVEGITNLLKLKPGKTADHDKLKPFLLKELAKVIAPMLQILFERSLQTGKLPADWCHALITPIFIKGWGCK